MWEAHIGMDFAKTLELLQEGFVIEIVLSLVNRTRVDAWLGC